MTQAKDPKRDFLGIGWAFPVRIDPNGDAALAVYDDDIQQSIHIILGTTPGERIMRPDFGAGLQDFLFEPVSTTTLTRIQERVRVALVRWEARIEVLDVRAFTDAAAFHLVLIDVRYRVRATNAIQNLVYPFYLQEGPSS